MAQLQKSRRDAAVRLASFAALCCLLAAPSVAATPMRNVLVLFSNGRLLPANLEADRGFRESIGNAATRNVEIYTEFLDQPAFSGDAYEQTVTSYIREKYATRPPEVLVVAGEQALEFLLRHRGEMFPDVPVVHMANSKAILATMPPMPVDVVGVPIEYDSPGTIQMALRWHPQARRLFIVTGASHLDQLRKSDLSAQLPGLQIDQTIEMIEALPTEALLKRLRTLNSSDVVFTPGYFRDGAGRAFAPRESASLMAAASTAPVYGPYATFIGTGVVGGRMPSYLQAGRQAALAVNDLLAGVAPGALHLPAAIPAIVQVDWRQVLRWKIDQGAIPADAITHFREPTFWAKYRTAAIVTLMVILLQTALIVALLLERRLRRRTASALEESEDHMNLAARAARLSVWAWDVARDKVWTAKGLHQHPGMPRQPPTRFDNVLETVHPDDRERFDRAVREAVARHEELEVEYRIIKPDGEIRWIAARGKAEKHASERLAGVALDVTARKAAEVQAEKDRIALTHMARVSMMGQLSASIAHQLNQPLAAILGNAEAARKMLDRENLDIAELKEICDDIVASDNRATEVIRRLGALFKRGEMKLALLNLNELVLETLDLVRTELMTRHVATVTELAPSLPMVEGGRVQLQQVLLNLILNGADAMSGSPEAERRLIVRTELDGGNVRLCVVDHGTGIAPGDIRNVFEAFWSTKPDGIGVGLAICQSIISAHQGTLTVANNPRSGATFCATWPLQQGSVTTRRS